VSLQVESGEVFGLLGRASGGPSSLLGIAAGLRLASGGRVRTLGREPALARSEIAEDIGVFDGDEELAGQLTVRETLELRLPRAAARVSADGVLERAGLFDDSARRVEELDAGGLRRLQLARALATDPAVAFLDDPTRDLDPSERDDVLAIVRRLREAGRTVVLATSSVFDVCAVCDRAALVLAGSVTAVDAPDALVREHFPRRSVHFETEREFDPGLLDEMPEVLSLSVEPRESAPGSAIAVETYQPDALMRLIGADVTLPRVVHLRAEDVADPFGAPAGPSAPEPSEQRGGR